MPTATTPGPAVSLSFANNFWGKEDAGVGPLLERMQGAKQTCDELRSFYGARASIEDEYARKLLSLCRKPLGSQETGSLKISMETMRGEVEAMAKQHQSNAAQMKTELEEPLAAFAGGMKERRKIVQNTVEKLLKNKIQQTQQANKTRDKYEQECLKIKGYLAQGHMVMGQEERRNKAKLEKTQISLATSNTEYETAIKALDETTGRWNREWKSAADKFQDLEEERLDFTKSSLWTFANIASTVCVSDDASCEKIRLSLEKVDVETDIIAFINEQGTGQEIPDPPKYINFCRGDINDNQSEVSEDEAYSVAQFPRNINPAFRASSPQPSTFESHHDPASMLANNLAHREVSQPNSREATLTPQKLNPQPMQPPSEQSYHSLSGRGRVGYDVGQHGPVAPIPHDPYPMDGMTMLCRTGPATAASDLSSHVTSARPSSKDSHSEYATSFSSQEPPSAMASPMKYDPVVAGSPEKKVQKKKSGFFQNHSPFRRKSTKDVQHAPVNRNTWHAASSQNTGSPVRRPQLYDHDQHHSAHGLGDRMVSPEPIDANASLALGVGQNVLPVTRSEMQGRGAQQQPGRDIDDNDPIALALAELKGVTSGKQSSIRISADKYHGIATPAPGQSSRASRSQPALRNQDVMAATRGTPPPSYHQEPASRLGVPPPAVTSKAMKEATKKVTSQTRNIFGEHDAGDYRTSPHSRSGGRSMDLPRATSPASARGASPHPQMRDDPQRMNYRSASPNPYGGRQGRESSQGNTRSNRGSDQGYYQQASPSGGGPSPASYREYGRSQSSYGGDASAQLGPGEDDGYGSQRGRGGGRQDSGAIGLYQGDSRQRSKSLADPSRQYSRDGRPILHFARALYVYQAAIPEELAFAKGDYLAVFRHQDDGWWEAEIQGTQSRSGLVPSNYLQPC